ncbi:MAG: hypothetical protein RIM99_07860 [Cyclobacteriaceae bacterium]
MRTLTLITLILYGYTCTSQEKKIAVKWFDEKVGNYSGIINGKAYKFEMLGYSHPFFKDESLASGNVFYNNQLYYDNELLYDISSDILVLKKDIRGISSLIQLNSLEIGYFTIHERKFVRTPVKKLNADYTFMEETFKGDRFGFYRRHEKTREASTKKKIIEYEESISYYISDNGKYSRLQNGKKLMKIYPELKDKIRNFARANDVSWRHHDDLLIVVSFLDKNWQ